jgi:hypothetical protein
MVSPAQVQSLNIQAAHNDRLRKIENQIELLALTVKEEMAAAKSLSKRGAARESSQNRARNPSGETYSANRQQTERSRSISTSGQRGREQSISPGRQKGNFTLTSERRSRRDDRSGSKGRERSIMARQMYPKMKKGENCSLDYDPLKMKSCSKCGKPGHHEFECYKYEKYSIKKCSVCDRLHHFAGDCKELEKFPPSGKELNSSEATKNW